MVFKRDLIIINLSILFFITIISILSGNNFIASAFVESQEYQQILNGTSSIVEGEGISADFSLDPLVLAVTWIIVIGVIAIASSITVVATGLSTTGTRWTVGMIFFVSIWLMLSTYPFPLIISGGIIMETIYLVMTMTYAIGCIMTLMGADI